MSPPPRPKRVLVCGYYGFGNTGDEAILTVLIDDLRAAFPGCLITVLSGDPVATAGQFQVEAIAWQSPADLISAAQEADLMVLGGGGLIQDYNGFDSSQMLTPHHGDVIWGEFALIARMWSKPLAIYGIGVGPLSTPEGRAAAQLTFDTATAATVRDQGSFDLIPNPPADLQVTADPVFRLEPSLTSGLEEVLSIEGVPEADWTIGVTVRPWRTGLPIDEIAKALDQVIEETSGRVVFVPFQMAPTRNENDAHAAHQVMLAMNRSDRAAILRGSYGPREKLALFKTFDAVIAMRLHAAMFGLMSGVPTVAISYDAKVTGLMDSVGVPELSVALNEVSSTNLLDRLGVAQKTSPEPIKGRLQQLRLQAEGNRLALERAGSASLSLTDPAMAMLGSAALARSADAAELETARFQSSVDQKLIDHLRAELAEIRQSRAQRLATTYWKARQDVRDAGHSLGRVFDRETRQKATTDLPPPERFNSAPDYGGVFELRNHYTNQLAEILKAHPQAIGYAVLPHSIGWRSSLFQRPQQMALALARLGYLVFYGLDHFTREDTDGFRRADNNVYLFSMDPHYLDVLKEIPKPLTLTYVYNFRFARHLHEPITVFEHIDELEVFTATHPMAYLEQWYEDAITNADIIAASAHDLLATVRKRRPEAVLCQNGVDFDHFAGRQQGPRPDDLPPPSRPLIGYYGAMAEWLDYPLIEHAAKSLPDLDFVFIGPNYDQSMDGQPAFQLDNVHWLGPKDYDELPNYLQEFSVATIPFVLNDVTHAVSPVKLHEYLAAGKPVVATAMREILTYDVVLAADDADDWVEKLELAVAMANDPANADRLRMTARANTWDQRVGVLIDAAARLHLG